MLASIFLRNYRAAIFNSKGRIFAGFQLPLHAKWIGRISGRAGNANNFAPPINSDQADFLLVEPRQNVEGNAAAAVQENYSFGQVGVAAEK